MRRTLCLCIIAIAGIIISQPNDPAEYREWKEQLCGQSYSLSMMPVITASNDYVAVQLEYGSTNYGRFNIGTANGNTLLYAYPSAPWSSWVIVRVDNVSYVAPGGGPSVTAMEPIPGVSWSLVNWPTFPDSSYIWGGWRVPSIPGIRVYQWLQPVILTYPTETTGTIFIKYVVVNADATCHNIGILLQMDTMVGTNDAAPLATTLGYSGIEEDFWNTGTAPFPAYYFAYEIGPSGPPTQLVALGILSGYHAVPPDRFAVGGWGHFYSTSWNLTPSGSPYGDSSVLLWWYPREICPGETLIVATYYGLGEPIAGQLVIQIPEYPHVENCNYAPNPFSLLSIFTNGSGTILTNVQARIILPTGLSLPAGETQTKLLSPSTLNAGASGTVGWNIQIDHAPAPGSQICVRVFAPGLSDTFQTCRDFPLPYVGRPPYGSLNTPFDNAVTSCPDQQIMVNFFAENGLTNVRFFVNNDTFGLTDPRLQWIGDSLLVFTPTTNWANGVIHRYGVVDATDNLGCPFTSPITGSFFVDYRPPTAWSPNPPNGAVLGTPDFGDVSLTIYDTERDVDPSSIVFVFEEDTYTVDGTVLQYSGDVLIFSPSLAGYTFGDGDTICCSLIDAADEEPDYCSANHITSPFSWCFYITIVDLWFPDTEASAGSYINIPVYIEDVTGLGITSLDIKIGYYSSVLTPIEVIEAGSLTQGWGDLSMTQIAPGTIRVTGGGSLPLTGRGVLFYIRFRVTNSMGTYSELIFREATFNGGDLNTNTTNGFLLVPWRPIQWSGTLYFITQNAPIEYLSFGTSYSSHNGYDALDVIYFAPTPDQIAAWFSITDTLHPSITKLVKDWRSSNDTLIIWTGYARYAVSGAQVRVRWNTTGLPDGMLMLTYTTPSGSITLDMHTDTSFVFSDSTRITIMFSRRSIERKSINLCSGWNMVSLPVYVSPDVPIREMIPNAVTDGYWYNPLSYGYDIITHSVPDKPFWVYVTSECEVNMAGVLVTTIQQHIYPGWNMLAVPYDEDGFVLFSEISTTPPGLLIPYAWWYDACGIHNYITVETLFVGQGYWVFSLFEGDITISSTLLKNSIRKEPVREFDIYVDDTRLTLAVDADASSSIDYMDILLPPPIPGDVDRTPALLCEGYRLTRDSRPDGNFEINNVRPGAIINWDRASFPVGTSASIMDGDIIIDMTQTNTWVAQSQRLKVSISSVPLSFTLLSTVPNPFNASVKIAFVIPKEDIVSLEIFDINGRKVSTLWNGLVQPGVTEVIWDGTNMSKEQVSSGIYFVRLTGGGKTETKSITLIK